MYLSNRISNIKLAIEQYGIVPRVFVINDPEEDVPDLYKYNPYLEEFDINYSQDVVDVRYCKNILGTKCRFSFKFIATRSKIKTSYTHKINPPNHEFVYDGANYAYYNLSMRFHIIKKVYAVVSNAVCKVAMDFCKTNLPLYNSELCTILHSNIYWTTQYNIVWLELYNERLFELELCKIMNIEW